MVLTGFMGSGKTEVGRATAGLLSRPFVDTDELIVAGAGMGVSEIFAKEGEPGFRAREAEAVEEVAERQGQVIALGGGAVLAVENRTLLKMSGLLVYLRATPETLMRRVETGEDRPLLAHGDRAARLRDLVAVRTPIYEAVADFVIDTDSTDVRRVAEEIVRWFTARVQEIRRR